MRVDVGIPAGKPFVAARSPLAVTSPHLSQCDWKASEAVRFSQKGMNAHPDAQTYQVEIECPSRAGKGEFTYVYDRTDDRIKVYTGDRPDRFYATEKLAGDLGKVTSLHGSSLKSQNMDKMPVRAKPAK